MGLARKIKLSEYFRRNPVSNQGGEVMKPLIYLLVVLSLCVVLPESGWASAEADLLNKGENLGYFAKRKRKRKKRRKRRRSNSKKKGYGKNFIFMKQGIKGILGLANMKGASPLIFGADFIYPLKMNNLTIDAGGLYWNSSTTNSSLSALTLDGGVGYHIPLSKKSTVEAGGRFGFAMVTAQVSSSLFGTSSSSETRMMLTPFVAFNMGMGKTNVVGAELRLPMAMSGEGDFDVTYIMGFYRF